MFPTGFRWGAATAAYQIEGSSDVDGRTPSIWDTFAATPGKVFQGHDGSVATDHYRRYADDVDIMKALGLKVYRFSVAWPRVHERGAAGLAFYDRLVDGLLANGIEPALTLYHWDLPQALEDAGGWTARETAYRFADYAALVADRLADRVALWTTLNEPWCAAFLGYMAGVHAPGRTSPADGLAAAHHLLLGHGLAVDALRAALPAGVPVSLVLNLGAIRAASSGSLDVLAARRVDGAINRIFLDPVFRGVYPQDVVEASGVDWAFVKSDDMSVISAPIDVLGVNYYQPSLVAHSSSPMPEPNPWPGCSSSSFLPIDAPVTGMDWAVDPTGLREVLLRVKADYGDVPMIVTENGAAYEDRVTGGAVHDAARIAYLEGHIGAVHEAIRAGADVRGYFVWSLLDNFEWAYGYSHRFGLVHVDYDTQQRTLKDSAYWYRDVIARNGLA